MLEGSTARPSLCDLRVAAIVALLAPLLVPSAASAEGAGDDLLPDVQVGCLRVRLESVAQLPSSVADIQNAGDASGRVFLVSPSGTIRILKDGIVQPEPFLQTAAHPPDRAMSGLAFHPAFSTNGKLYVLSGEAISEAVEPDFSAPQELDDGAFDDLLLEYHIDVENPERVDADSRRELLRIRDPHFVHKLNHLTFGGDGYLYLVLGDGGDTRSGSPTHYNTNAQLTTNPFGKVLRIDVDTLGENGKYGIPETNPFSHDTTGNVREIFAWGLRNPWRVTTDRVTGEVYTGVNGDFTIEWVVRVKRAANYGWDLREGSFLWNPQTGDATVAPTPNPSFEPPLAEYDHNWSDNGYGSVIGGYVYRGTRLPQLYGKYIFLDWLAAELFAMNVKTGELERIAVDTDGAQLQPARDITFGEDESGELYIGRSNGEVLRVVPRLESGQLCYRHGDCNHDGALDISDPVTILLFLFDASLLQRSPTCELACDANSDDAIEISDAIFQLQSLFTTTNPLDGQGECKKPPQNGSVTCEIYELCAPLF